MKGPRASRIVRHLAAYPCSGFGFPELAYSRRKIMVPLATAGFHVLAPDQRGYGRTTGWDGDYDGDLASFRRLNWYRSGDIGAAEQQLFTNRTIDQPSIFISGASDWGSYQSPGALERMRHAACTDLRGVHMIAGAGHWVQQEQPEQTSRLLIDFLRP
jgi:pimeloyl-ACP methyl ester carboxylesterase